MQPRGVILSRRDTPQTIEAFTAKGPIFFGCLAGSQAVDHALHPAIGPERLQTLFPAEARMPGAPEGDLHTAAPIVVDRHLPALEVAAEPKRVLHVTGIEPGHQPIAGAIGRG